MPKNPPAPIHIRIDTQEQWSGIPDLLAAMPQVHIEVIPLRMGDYDVVKAVYDLEHSGVTVRLLPFAPLTGHDVTPLADSYTPRTESGPDPADNLHPGETVQPWHFDDGGIKVPRPRPALGISAFWAIDDTTEQNGATEIIPGSHLWDGQYIEGALRQAALASDHGGHPHDLVGRDLELRQPVASERRDQRHVGRVAPSGHQYPPNPSPPVPGLVSVRSGWRAAQARASWCDVDRTTVR